MNTKSTNSPIFRFGALLTVLLIGIAIAQSAWKSIEPWRPDQLMAPADLAAVINSSQANKPLIISIGPAGTIKSSVEIGPGQEAGNIAKLEQLLSKEPKDRAIVIYCGCCPFRNCPNVRPAFTKLNEMGFKNHKLLNLANNLKTDWLDMGYPVAE